MEDSLVHSTKVIELDMIIKRAGDDTIATRFERDGGAGLAVWGEVRLT
jgi:hypothetical protein